jgi:hypothetical protein
LISLNNNATAQCTYHASIGLLNEQSSKTLLECGKTRVSVKLITWHSAVSSEKQTKCKGDATMCRGTISRSAATIIACNWWCPIIAHATPINYVSQQRFVEVSASLSDPGENFSERVDAVAFEPFDVQLDRTFTNGESAASGHAGQTSEFQNDRIGASGTVVGETGPPVGTSSGSGHVLFAVAFRIETSLEYELRFAMEDVEFGSYRLTGPSLDHAGDVNMQPVLISSSGDLLPGDYSFLVEIQNGGTAEGFTGAFDFDFAVVPEPTSWAGVGGAVYLVPVLMRRHRRIRRYKRA